MRSKPTSVSVRAVRVSSASSRWDRLRRNGWHLPPPRLVLHWAGPRANKWNENLTFIEKIVDPCLIPIQVPSTSIHKTKLWLPIYRLHFSWCVLFLIRCSRSCLRSSVASRARVWIQMKQWQWGLRSRAECWRETWLMCCSSTSLPYRWESRLWGEYSPDSSTGTPPSPPRSLRYGS